jgi:copper homeostasis protein
LEKNEKIKVITEVVVFSAEGAIAAQNGGADRVELCENVHDGGTTPSYGTIVQARKNLSIRLHVMIRPRSGDFSYSDVEFEIMKSDIEQCKNLGVDGVVFGILNYDAGVDKNRCKQLVELAKPMTSSFHRAFDRTKNPLLSLEDVIECGFARILTSGQKPTALEGINLISELNRIADNRIIIMPGGGVREDNVIDIMAKSGTFEFHTSARNIKYSKVKYRKNPLAMGSNFKLNEFEILGTDEAIIKQFVGKINLRNI